MTSILSAPPAPALTIERATFFHAGRRGVEDVTLTLPPGAILGLLGPNGSGKSTLLSLVAGTRTPTSGSLRVFGQPVSRQARACMGILFQESCLDPLMSVRETLWLHGRLFGLGRTPLRHRIGELLRLIGLDDRAADAIETLSGGMKRRLEIARAVLHRPKLLLLDEPTLGLDPDSTLALWEVLQRVNADGAAFLIATNDVTEAERYCQTVAFLDHGRVVQEGSPAAFKRALRRDAVRVEWPHPPADIVRTLAAWDGVGAVTWVPPLLHATVDDASRFIPHLFAIADGSIRTIRIEESTLEDAYFKVVGAPLSTAGPLVAAPATNAVME